MRNLTQKIALLSTVVLLTGLLIARQIGEASTENDFYQLTEWSIFYPGHFIRRGLRGTVLQWLSHVTHVHLDLLIRVLNTLSYTVLVAVTTAYLFRWLWGKARSWIPLLLLSPAGAFFYVNSIMAIGRFDVFFILITVAHLEICMRVKDTRTYTLWAIALFATFGTASVLCHEAFLFLCVPANAMLSWRRLGGRVSSLLLIYGVPAAATLVCALTRVRPQDVITLSRALHVPIGSSLWYSSPLCLFALPLGGQAQVVRALLSFVSFWPFALTVVCFGAIHYFVLKRLVKASGVSGPAAGWLRPEAIWPDLCVVPFLCTVPLYDFGADYGRWFVIVVTTFTLCCCRLLTITNPVKPASKGWTLAATLVFVFVPVPLSLRLPNEGPELLSWSGAVILGHFLGPPPPPIEPMNRDSD